MSGKFACNNAYTQLAPQNRAPIVYAHRRVAERGQASSSCVHSDRTHGRPAHDLQRDVWRSPE